MIKMKIIETPAFDIIGKKTRYRARAITYLGNFGLNAAR